MAVAVGVEDLDGLFDGEGLGDFEGEGEGEGEGEADADAEGDRVGSAVFVFPDVQAATIKPRIKRKTKKRRGTTLMMM